MVVPLLRIAGQLKHIEDFCLDRITRVASPLRELDKLSGILLQMSRGLASFQKYMPTGLSAHWSPKASRLAPAGTNRR